MKRMFGWATERGFEFYDQESGINLQYDIESGITVKIKKYQEFSKRIDRSLQKERIEESMAYFLWLRENYPERWREIAEWHAVEHKLIGLLENEIEVNLENLQKAPSFFSRCNTGKNQEDILAEPSLKKLEEAVKVAEAYFQKLKEKQSP